MSTLSGLRRSTPVRPSSRDSRPERPENRELEPRPVARRQIRGESRSDSRIIPDTSGTRDFLDKEFKKTRASLVERRHTHSVMWISFGIIMVASAIFFLLGWVVGKGDWTLRDFFYNMGCNILALFVVVLCLDALTNRNSDYRLKRDEARKILRHNRLINPEIDMYLVRKNMVITPNDKTIRKFQVVSQFSVRDMRDMYGPSDLVSDVGISKIRRYAHYQSVLRNYFEKLVESVDFVYYPEIAEAAMKFLNATSYGEAALNAILNYEEMKAGTKSMRALVIAMMREEPENGSFVSANPTMKNVYLVHQMIVDQEHALEEYIKMIKILEEKDPEETRRSNGKC